MEPTFFAEQSDFREWLEKNHAKESELLVGFYKVSSGKPSITWSQSVDEALCFGWIDGIRNSINPESYSIRFTPRKPGSAWSKINIQKVNELTIRGLMFPSGITAFNKRKENKSGIYSFDNRPEKLTCEFEKQFRNNKPAWNYFLSQAPSYRRTAIFWVMSPKQEITKQKRLNTLIKDCEKGQKIKPLSYGTKNV